MDVVFAARIHPGPENPAILGSKRVPCVRRRHLVIRIIGLDPQNQLAVIRLARFKSSITPKVEKSAFSRIQSEFGLAGLFVRTMAGKAIGGEDRSHVLVEGYFLGNTSDERIRKDQRQ
jgi:hypothetical protein